MSGVLKVTFQVLLSWQVSPQRSPWPPAARGHTELLTPRQVEVLYARLSLPARCPFSKSRCPLPSARVLCVAFVLSRAACLLMMGLCFRFPFRCALPGETGGAPRPCAPLLLLAGERPARRPGLRPTDPPAPGQLAQC